MKLFAPIKRLMFYGLISSLATAPVVYFVGYNKGTLDTAVEHKNASKLEKISENKYTVVNPDNFKRYEIDFENEEIRIYSSEKHKKKKLEDIFK